MSGKFAYAEPRAEDLEQAAEILKVNGWIQGASSDELGRHCAIGAVNEVIGGRYWIDPERLAELMQIQSGFDEGTFTPVAAWNDWPGRTKEEVIDRLMLAAKTLRNAGEQL